MLFMPASSPALVKRYVACYAASQALPWSTFRPASLMSMHELTDNSCRLLEADTPQDEWSST